MLGCMPRIWAALQGGTMRRMMAYCAPHFGFGHENRSMFPNMRRPAKVASSLFEAPYSN
jgi:hypothetical protein